MSARAAGISRLNQQVSTFKHTHDAVSGTHLFTQYCPENSFSFLTHGLLVGQLGLSMWAIKNARKEEPEGKPDYFTLFPEVTSQHFFHILIIVIESLYVLTRWKGNTQNNDHQPLGSLKISQILHPLFFTTVSSLKTCCSKQFKTQILSPAYSQIHPTTSAKLPWTQTTIWVKPLPLEYFIDLTLLLQVMQSQVDPWLLIR